MKLKTLISTLLLALPLIASASDTPASKPIKRPIEKDESASSKEDKKSSSKESKESASKAKEAAAADELAIRIAERLATLKKEKEDASPRAVPPRPGTYAPPVRSPYAPKPKASASAAPAAMQATEKKDGHGSTSTGSSSAVHDPRHWSYQGETGPANWAKINPENAKCDLGTRQSPIDIRDGIKVELEPIVFDYKPTRFAVIDNGHTIQVNVGAGNYIGIMGQNYELVQFHFHKPSEERINGKSFEMVTHMVHKDADGKLAVIAILMERGKQHPIIQQVWNNLPLEKHEALHAQSTLNLMNMLPQKTEYYTYMGSLTTPPCSEGVLWMVMKEPIEISNEQLGIFSRLYPMNARPIQKQSGRIIKESN